MAVDKFINAALVENNDLSSFFKNFVLLLKRKFNFATKSYCTFFVIFSEKTLLYCDQISKISLKFHGLFVKSIFTNFCIV